MSSNPALARALIVGRLDLYQRNASFHFAIDNLVTWLPLWVEAIARASIAEVAREETLRKMLESGAGGEEPREI